MKIHKQTVEDLELYFKHNGEEEVKVELSGEFVIFRTGPPLPQVPKGRRIREVDL